MNPQIEQLYTELLVSFMKLLELRNPYNIDHCKLVCEFSDKLAEHCGFSRESRTRLERAAEIHTLGVLLQMEEKQKGRHLPISGLNEETGREQPSHLREESILARVLDEVPYYRGCKEILIQRHEWFDGSGSIYGLSGTDICAEARLLAVADAYVDLVTPKAHRPSESSKTAIIRIKELSGSQFDPAYVSALTDLFGKNDDEEQSARNQKFREAHCRHYLGLGHFYTQIHETDWALRSYVAAQRIAEDMEEPGLRLASISGQFMVFCDLNQLERARETLRQVRLQGNTKRDKLGYQLLWGLLEWLSGNKLGGEILSKVIEQHEKSQNIPGLTAALGFQACMTLFHEGANSPNHLHFLKEFLKVAANHDVFDVVERYRPFTIPVLLNAVVQGVQEGYARNTLTIMGEPCQGPLHDKLKDKHPSQWTKTLMPESSLAGEEEKASLETQEREYDVFVTTIGKLAFTGDKGTISAKDWQTQNTVLLFLKLANEAGRPINTEMLAEELWPNVGPQKARDSLRNCIYQVRKTVKQILNDQQRKITSRSRKNNTIAFELSCRFDYEDFEEALKKSQRLFSDGKLEQAEQILSSCLEQNKGEFLQGFDEDWIQAKRAQLWNTKIEGLTTLGHCFLGMNRWSEAESCAYELLQLDDLREQSHILLILAVGKAGRASEAVELYQKASDLFEAEIGVAPKALRRPLEELELLL